MNAPAIVVDGVSKTFARPHHREHTLKERALHPFRRRTYDEFQALDDVSFAVQDGEFFGIVGRNGSGKSTLLKLMAGIYKTTAGQIWVRGRMSTFIELGVGFNPDLAARDNVYLNAIMLGLTPAQARERYERVIEFAELREFEDLKLKNYSSGMHVRLAFSVMIQVDAEVLLIDEVLAVGDAAFQQKCFDEFNRLRDEGRTIVLVTHDMSAVRRFCHRAMLIERGKLVAIGQPERVGAEYLDLNFSARTEQPQVRLDADPDEERHGDGRALITDCWLEDETGEPLPENVPHGTVIVLKAVIEFHAEMEHPSVGVAVEAEDRRMVFGANTIWGKEKTGVYRPGDHATVTLRFTNRFAASRYHISPAVAKRGSGLELADQRVRFRSFVSTAPVVTGGVVDLDYDMELRPGAETPPRVDATRERDGMSAVVETTGGSPDVERIAAAGGVRISGPSALGGGWRRILSLTWTLGYLDWRLAFFGSVLGYLWRLFKPAMYFGVYYILWTQFIPLSDNVLFYAPLLLCGIMLYIFFSEATSMAVQSVLVRENLVRKIHFPRVVIPMSVITTALLNLVFNLFAVLIFMAVSGVPLRSTAWQVIPTFLFFLVFISALCMLLSSLFVRYRDVQPIWEVFSMAIFYATPILYPLEAVQLEWAQKLIMHNPFAITIQQIRHAVFDPSVPSAAEAIGGWGELSLVIAAVCALFVFGLWTFNRIAPDVAEEL